MADENNLEEQEEQQQEEQQEEVQDKHGNPGISRDKYQRDMAKKDAEIAELRAKVDEAAKTEEGRAELQKQMDELKAAWDADKAKFNQETTNMQLEAAGCIDVELASAAMAKAECSIEDLKKSKPYLFKQKGATGGKPTGAVDPEDAMLERMRSIAGIKKKE